MTHFLRGPCLSVLPLQFSRCSVAARRLTADPSRQTAGKRSLEAAGDAAAALSPSRRGMREVGVGGIRGPTTKHSAPKY